MATPATIVFDLDGTLADTSGDLLAAANACLAAYGPGACLTEADAGTALRGGRAMLRLGLGRIAEVDEMAAAARAENASVPILKIGFA